jgi:3',5'-cyclic AMP phosphodiesterase CpdA
VHITTNPLGWTRRDYFSKRLTGWINLRWLRGRFRFRQAEAVLAALVGDLRQRQPDHVVFSGDATNLGFEAEFARATAILGVHGEDRLPGLAVPGNHDYYTRAVVSARLFEQHFAPWQGGVRVDDATYPFAQRVGPLWLVAVNSCVPSRWMWDASGRVGGDQLDRLERLLDTLGPGPRILVTHYPVVRACGNLERKVRSLRDLKDLVSVAERGKVALWLHGHRHGPYHHARTNLAPFPVICAGSATQKGLWCYGEYTIDGSKLTATRRAYDPREGQFRDFGTFELELPA